MMEKQSAGQYLDIEEQGLDEVGREKEEQNEIIRQIEESEGFRQFMNGFQDLWRDQQFKRNQNVHNKLRFSLEEERYLMVLVKRQYKESNQAKTLLYESLKDFIYKCVLQCTKNSKHKLFPDLLNEGCLGLLEAVNKYDLSRSVKLITYSAYWIKMHIREFYISNVKLTSLPNNRYFRYRRACKELIEENRRAFGDTDLLNNVRDESSADSMHFVPEVEAVAKRMSEKSGMNITADTVRSVKMALSKVVFLDAPYMFAGGKKVSRYELLPDNSRGFENSCVDNDARKIIFSILESLNPTYRYVLLRRFGFRVSRSDIESMLECRGLSGKVDVDSLQKRIYRDRGENSVFEKLSEEMGGISRQYVQRVAKMAMDQVHALLCECGIEGVHDVLVNE